MLASLKIRLRAILDEANQLKHKRADLGTVSRFNIFKRTKLKYQVGTGLTATSKALYDWENEYAAYKDCLTLSTWSVLVAYAKLVFGVLAAIFNILLVVDM